MGNDMSELTNGELLSLMFTNPFVTKKVQHEAFVEYQRRMKEEVLNKEINKNGKN